MSVATIVEIVVPRLSEAMTDATLVAWLKADGERVRAEEPLVELETDKSTVVHPAEASGTLRIVVPEGEVVAVGALIARIVPDGTAPPPGSPPASPAAPPLPLPAPRTVAGGEGPPPPASPLARRLAALHGVDLGAVDGNGPGGMVLRGDVLRAARRPDDEGRIAAGPRTASPPSAPVAGRRGEVTAVAQSRVQRLVAERMALSHATVPDFTMRVDVDMDEASALRRRLGEAVAGPAPSFNDMVVKATALALRRLPAANAAMRDGAIERYARVNIGIAVAAPDALLVPVVCDADQLSLGAIATESRRLAGAAREGTIAPEDLEGGTFTVSNLGMYGLRSFTAVINPPQAAILAVGAVRSEPVVRDGEVRPGLLMALTLSGDHRVLNGVDGAELLAAIAGHLESPLGLALG